MKAPEGFATLVAGFRFKACGGAGAVESPDG